MALIRELCSHRGLHARPIGWATGRRCRGETFATAVAGDVWSARSRGPRRGSGQCEPDARELGGPGPRNSARLRRCVSRTHRGREGLTPSRGRTRGCRREDQRRLRRSTPEGSTSRRERDGPCGRARHDRPNITVAVMLPTACAAATRRSAGSSMADASVSPAIAAGIALIVPRPMRRVAAFRLCFGERKSSIMPEVQNPMGMSVSSGCSGWPSHLPLSRSP